MKTKWTVDKIRKTWLEFWKSKDHLELPSQSLIPINDQSLMWINSGVATLKKYFSGQEKPPYPRLTSCQKAIRTNDIFYVGHTSRHHTFFEMLGNFSIGNYFKKEAIDYAFELLTKTFSLSLDKLYITVFEKDEETYQLWLKNGIKKNHIIKCDEKRNFWDVGSGPCGPCTEIYYDRGDKYDAHNEGEELFKKDVENDRYVEIWNIVFSQYNNDGKGNYHELAQKNIDTGAGLERLACILQDVPTNFEIDTFQKIIKEIEKFTTHKYDAKYYPQYLWKELSDKPIDEYFKWAGGIRSNWSFRIIADHIRAACFAIADGSIPNNKGRGYVIRKLIRRAILHGHDKLNIKKNFIDKVAISIIEVMKNYHFLLVTSKKQIIKVLINEENLFRQTLTKALNLFKQTIKNRKFDGQLAFELYDTYGLPFDSIVDLVSEEKEHGNFINDDWLKSFVHLYRQHREISKNKNIVLAMQEQNANLVNFKKESEFAYSIFHQKGKIIGIFDESFNLINNLDQKKGTYWFVFDKTCLYAASGGQNADQGTIKINDRPYKLINCIKGPNLQHFHCLNFVNPITIKIGDIVETVVDVDNRKIISAHHTCIHLLQKSLKLHVNQDIKQEGSLITNTKASFDFNYSQKLTNKQLEIIENQINDWIKSNFVVTTKLMTFDEAIKFGAIGYFEKVYEKVKTKLRVVIIDKITSEICAGTHVNSLGEIGQFRILKLIAKGSGCWRIEFICTTKLIGDYLYQKNNEFNKIIQQLKEKIDSLGTKTTNIIDKSLSMGIINFKQAKTWFEFKKNSLLVINLQEKIEKAVNNFKKEKMAKTINEYLNNFAKNFSSSTKKHILLIENQPIEVAQSLSKSLITKYQHCYFLILNLLSEKIFYILIKHKSSSNMIAASDLVKIISKKYFGKGGGKDDYAQGIIPFSNENLEQIKILFLEK